MIAFKPIQGLSVSNEISKNPVQEEAVNHGGQEQQLACLTAAVSRLALVSPRCGRVGGSNQVRAAGRLFPSTCWV